MLMSDSSALVLAKYSYYINSYLIYFVQIYFILVKVAYLLWYVVLLIMTNAEKRGSCLDALARLDAV